MTFIGTILASLIWTGTFYVPAQLNPAQETAPYPQLLIAPAPVTPVATIGSAIVILGGTVNDQGGLINLSVLHGSPPFIEPSLRAARQWSFAPAEPEQDNRVSITFLYRAQRIMPDRPHELDLPHLHTGPAGDSGDHPALPARIVDPGYPVNSIAQGFVIIQAEINTEGTVQRLNVVRDEPSLTDPAVRAARDWRFAPATLGNRETSGNAVIAISFQRPVLVH